MATGPHSRSSEARSSSPSSSSSSWSSSSSSGCQSGAASNAGWLVRFIRALPSGRIVKTSSLPGLSRSAVRQALRALATCGCAPAGRPRPSVGSGRAAGGIRRSERSGWVRRDRAVQRRAEIIWTVHGQGVEDTVGVESGEDPQRTARLANCLGTDPGGGLSPSGNRPWMRGSRGPGR
jgi:hypothetical protein